MGVTVREHRPTVEAWSCHVPFVLCSALLAEPPDHPLTVPLVPVHDLSGALPTAMLCPASLMPVPLTSAAAILLVSQTVALFRLALTLPARVAGAALPGGSFPLGRAAVADRDGYFPIRPADAAGF
jgi:hypothetical protein